MRINFQHTCINRLIENSKNELSSRKRTSIKTKKIQSETIFSLTNINQNPLPNNLSYFGHSSLTGMIEKRWILGKAPPQKDLFISL